jgi:hypothetical protein
MSIPLSGRLHWRQKAPFHVQLKLEKPSDQLPAMSVVEVEGRVVRMFRSDGRLGLGDSVAFKLWVCLPGDEPTGPAYIYHDAFVRATHMEIYLYGNPPKCEVAAYEFAVISGPSDQPTLTIQELEELVARYEDPVEEFVFPVKSSMWPRLPFVRFFTRRPN